MGVVKVSSTEKGVATIGSGGIEHAQRTCHS